MKTWRENINFAKSISVPVTRMVTVGPAVDENLLNLTDISEINVLHVIEDRFNNKRIYTNVGDVLLAINPFEKYKIYDESVIAQYQQSNEYAHIFTPARCAVENIRNGSNFESIVFSGESNSGKSFNALQLMKYLVTSPNSEITVKQIEAITNIFNSFGCAKTVKNEDATRFGYCIEFLYKKNRVVGLNVCNTLPLETIRVVSQRPGERNFNVFYELCAGMPSDTKVTYGIRDQQKFFYMAQGKVVGDVGRQDDSDKFERLDSSLEIVGFTDEQRQTIYKTLATILHLGNMYFRQRRDIKSESSHVEMGNDVELKWASYLLDVDIDRFTSCFTHKIAKTDDGLTRTPYCIGQALDVRDAVAMTLYEVLFNWIVNRISSRFKCADHTAVISIIDCYGIERYNNNGLEQLLINTVNEKLESAFIKQTFLNEMAYYANEGLVFDWKNTMGDEAGLISLESRDTRCKTFRRRHRSVPSQIPSTLENEKVIDLLCKKPYGLLHLIDDECKFPKTSDESYLRHCNLNHLDKSVYGKAKNKDKQQMLVRHSFGTTWYNVHGFVQRNKRSLPIQIANVLAKSQNPVISMLFRSMASDREYADYTVYAANQFNTSSTALIEEILSGRSHFIRCLKSNNERLPATFDTTTLARQLNAFSVLETLHFRQVGFPIRIPFKRFTQSYRCLLPSEIAFCQNQKEIIVDILDGQGVRFANDFKIGLSYVFLRNRLADQLLATAERVQRDAAHIIQKTIRMYIVRKRYLRKRNAVIRIQAAVRGWKARKESCVLREQIFNKLSNQTKRNRRLSVYYEALKSEYSDQKCPSVLFGFMDTKNMPWKEVESPSFKDSKPNDDNIKITTNYLPIKLKRHIDIIEPTSIEKFAAENFKGHLLEPRRGPILTPFLHKECNADFRLSLEIFKLILKYMNDQTLSREQLDDLGRYIVKQGINHPCQRDEIFVQLCNQIYRNPNKEAQSRCCRLLLHAVGTFAPTKSVLPMLISFCGQQRSSLQTQLLNTIARRMNIPDNETARLLPASFLEMRAIYNLHNPAVEVNSQDGQTHVVEAHSWITNEELVNKVLRHRGIGNPNGWGIELETKSMLYYPTAAHFLHDVISEIELGKEENKKSVELAMPLKY
ncbi:hypothetical protein KIN20_000586 [Parelaphostrongylus tenuis]|uniref:Uncharacterized protein n=1 Tax=Parelaphostrongylus tenuis TaxID=148309 RepID=A0AAD5MKV7_PARTN|nr:hypothetical protein KIN20_000586 [Parelaphostrongylus tenuis]